MSTIYALYVYENITEYTDGILPKGAERVFIGEQHRAITESTKYSPSDVHIQKMGYGYEWNGQARVKILTFGPYTEGDAPKRIEYWYGEDGTEWQIDVTKDVVNETV